MSILLTLLGTVGCGAAARRSAGGTAMAIGAGAGLVGVRLIVGGCTDNDGDSSRVVSPRCLHEVTPNPTAGAGVLTAGLTTIVLGGILFASGVRRAPATTGTRP